MATPLLGRVARKSVTPLTLSHPDELLQQGRRLYRLVARRAYELYERRGRTRGQDISDWLQAESEIIHPCHYSITESLGCVIFRLALLGTFTADQVKVSVAPRRVMVSAEREVMIDYISSNGRVTKPGPQRFFHLENLPVEVDPSRSRATLGFEQLEILMPKALTAHPNPGCSPERANHSFRRFDDAFPGSERL
jgi:hypothetical protein